MSLSARGITVSFGGVLALADVSLDLERGEMLGLIGPNGAGKTTLVNVLSGFQRPSRGEIRVDGQRIDGLSPEGFAHAGIVRSFQAVRPFGGLSVRENVEAALVAAGEGRARARVRALDALEAVDLTEKAAWPAHALSYGEARRLGVARALAAGPRHLLLDEPAAGLDAREAKGLGTVIRRIRDQLGCGVLLIEHNIAFVSAFCERVQVLDGGRPLAQGPPTAILADPAVRAAYLGADAGAVA